METAVIEKSFPGRWNAIESIVKFRMQNRECAHAFSGMDDEAEFSAGIADVDGYFLISGNIHRPDDFSVIYQLNFGFSGFGRN